MPFFRFRFLLVLLAGGFFAHPAASDTAAIIPIHLLLVFHTSLVLPEIVKNRRPVSCCMSCCIFLKKGFFCETFSRRKKENFPKTEKKNRINTEFFSIHAVLTFGPPGGMAAQRLRLALPVLAAKLLRTSRLKTCRWHVFSTPLTLSGFESPGRKNSPHKK